MKTMKTMKTRTNMTTTTATKKQQSTIEVKEKKQGDKIEIDIRIINVTIIFLIFFSLLRKEWF
jgi:hypothetical protein